MMFKGKRYRVWVSLVAVIGSMLTFAGPSYPQKEIMGQIQFTGATRVDKHAGIWVDGQYVGYVSELNGGKKVVLLPGEHQIVARKLGYKDFTETVLVEPEREQSIIVKLERDPRDQIPAVTAEIKLSVTPSRAAVFLDDGFLGPIHDFDGSRRRSLYVSPGKHRIKIALPGYQTFETEVNLLPNQKFTVKTRLEKGSITQAGPLIKAQQ